MFRKQSIVQIEKYYTTFSKVSKNLNMNIKHQKTKNSNVQKVMSGCLKWKKFRKQTTVRIENIKNDIFKKFKN